MSQSFVLPTNQQVSSPFFSRLPLEIRLQIYEEVVNSFWPGTDTIHIIETVESAPYEPAVRFASAACTFTTENDDKPPIHQSAHHQYCDLATAARIKQRRRTTSEDTNLAIFHTSKKIYFEAIPLLYSSLIFRFDYWDVAYLFLESLPAHHLGQIRALHISGPVNAYSSSRWPYNPSYVHCNIDQTVWSRLLTILKSLKLIRLRLDVDLGPFHVKSLSDEQQIIQDLWDFRLESKGRPVQALLCLPVPSEKFISDHNIDTRPDMSGAPFRIDKRPWKLHPAITGGYPERELPYVDNDIGPPIQLRTLGPRNFWGRLLRMPVTVPVDLATMTYKYVANRIQRTGATSYGA